MRFQVAVLLAVAALGPGCVFYLNPQCDDQIQNGDETDVDCGAGCGPCGLDRGCDVGTDCKNGNCTGGVCTRLPCENGVRDGDETDVDCGGGTCRRCAGGRTCAVDGDCFGGCEPGAHVCRSLSVVSFDPAVAYGASDKTYALFSADLDGDGNLDLAAANEQQDSVTVFLNNGDGIFTRLAPDFATGAYPTGGTIADFNRDGIPDVVTANYHGDSVSLLFGNGDGSLEAPRTYATVDGAATANLAVGDLNRDGFPDVVAANPETDSVSEFLGRADGTLDPGIEIPIGLRGGSAPFSVAIADFNGDGMNDLAVADMTSRSIILKLGNGDGSFGAEVGYPEGGTPPYIIIAADMDLDGNIDAVVANRDSSDVSVLRGFGDGTFDDPVVSSTGPGTGPYSIAVADFNQDGVPDVVTANFMTNNASVLIGVGNGSFDPAIDAGAMGQFSYGVVAGDWDGDTKPDIATCNAISNDVTVKRNTSQ